MHLAQKVLLALIVAAVVGLSETVLFMIWQSKYHSGTGSQMKYRRAVKTRSKKDDGEAPSTSRPSEKMASDEKNRT